MNKNINNNNNNNKTNKTNTNNNKNKTQSTANNNNANKYKNRKKNKKFFINPNTKGNINKMQQNKQDISDPTYIQNIGYADDAIAKKVIFDYVRMMVDPHHAPSVRRPDSSNAKTVLYHSIMELSWVVDFGNLAQNTANFGVVIAPKLGNINSTADAQYYVSYVSWPESVSMNTIPFSDPTIYKNSILGIDPRVDPNLALLSSPVPGSYFAHFQNVGGYFFGGVKTVSLLGINLTPNVLPNRIDLTEGMWLISYYVFSTVNSGVFSGGDNPAVSNGTLVSILANGGYYDVCIDGRSRYYQYIVYATDSAFITQVTQYNAQYDVDLSITSCLNSKFTPPMDNGIIKKIRPLACSALFTFTGSSLNNAGSIACLNVPGDTLDDNVFTNNNPRNYLSWPILAALPGAYSGPIKDGAYIWWSPQSPLDSVLLTPSEMAKYQYPSLIISGSFSNISPLTGQVTIGRIIIDTIYEYTTTSTAFPTEKCFGSASMVDAIQNLTQTAPKGSSNPEHIQSILTWARMIAKYIGNHALTIGQIANGISKML